MGVFAHRDIGGDPSGSHQHVGSARGKWFALATGGLFFLDGLCQFLTQVLGFGGHFAIFAELVTILLILLQCPLHGLVHGRRCCGRLGQRYGRRQGHRDHVVDDHTLQRHTFVGPTAPGAALVQHAWGYDTQGQGPAGVVAMVGDKIGGTHEGKASPALGAQQQVECERGFGVVRVEVDGGIGQFLDVGLKQDHDRQARSLLAGLDHFQHAVIGDRDAHDGLNRLAAFIHGGEGQLDLAGGGVAIAIGLDRHRDLVGRLTVDEAFSQGHTVTVPDRRNQDAVGRGGSSQCDVGGHGAARRFGSADIQ